MYDLLAPSAIDTADESAQRLGPTLGRITEISENGKVLVDFEGNERPPIAARLVAKPLNSFRINDVVMLVFEQGDPTLPIILGAIVDRLPEPALAAQQVEVTLTEKPGAHKHAIVDGKKITLEAHDEIVLRCGKSSITLRKNGKILVKGTELVSHATGTNRVKGSSVAIN